MILGDSASLDKESKMDFSTDANVLFVGIKIENSFPFDCNGEDAKTYERITNPTKKDARIKANATFLFFFK